MFRLIGLHRISVSNPSTRLQDRTQPHKRKPLHCAWTHPGCSASARAESLGPAERRAPPAPGYNPAVQSRVEDVSKPQRAWQQIDSPSDCKHHTLYCCYSLEGKLGDVPTHALTAYFHDLGRFEHLFTEVDTLLPRVVGQHHWSPKSLTGHRTTEGQILSVETALLTSQLSGVVLLLQLGYEGSLPDVTGLLAGTCFGKTELCLDGVPMLEAVRRQARLDLQGSGDSQDSLSLELGRDVHQIVAIASDCQSELIGATPLGR